MNNVIKKVPIPLCGVMLGTAALGNLLTIPSEPAVPISQENRAAFEYVRDRIVAELNGEVAEEERITQLDSLIVPQPATEIAAVQP